MLNNDKSKKEIAKDKISERSLEDYVSKLSQLFQPDRNFSNQSKKNDADRYLLSFDHQILSINPLFKFHSAAVSATLGCTEAIKKSKNDPKNRSHIEFYKCIFDCVTNEGINNSDLVKKINDYADPEGAFLNYQPINEWIESAINNGLLRCELRKLNPRSKGTKYYFPGGLTYSQFSDILMEFDDEDSDIKSDFCDFIAFSSMINPLGSIGYHILQMLGMDNFSLADFEQNIFSYHNSYIVSTLDDSIVYSLLDAAKYGYTVEFSSYTPENFEPRKTEYPIRAIPLMIRQSSRNGCRYGVFFDPVAPEEDSLFIIRLDKIESLFILKQEDGFIVDNFAQIKEKLIRRAIESWGCRVTANRKRNLVRVLLHLTERHSIARLINEKRTGTIKEIYRSENSYYVIYETYNEDPAEMQSWLKTHISQIIKIECSEPNDLNSVFESDLAKMCSYYKIDITGIKNAKYIKKGYHRKQKIENSDYNKHYKNLRNNEIPTFISDCISNTYIELFKRTNAVTTLQDRRWLLTALKLPQAKIFLKVPLIEKIISELYKSGLTDKDIITTENIYQCFDCNNEANYTDWWFSNRFMANYHKLIALCHEAYEFTDKISENSIVQIAFIPKKCWLDYMREETAAPFIKSMTNPEDEQLDTKYTILYKTGIPLKIEYDLCERMSRLLFLTCNPKSDDQRFRIEKIIINNIVSINRCSNIQNKDEICNQAFEGLKTETFQTQYLKNVFCSARYKMGAVFVKVLDKISDGNEKFPSDTRNGKMRLMTTFSAYRVQAIRNDQNSYIAAITFCQTDYLQIVVKLLGFGPCIEVLPYDDQNFLAGLLVKKNSPEYNPSNDATSNIILKTVASLVDEFKEYKYFYELSKTLRQKILNIYIDWQRVVYDEMINKLNHQVKYTTNTTDDSIESIESIVSSVKNKGN